MLGCFSPPPLVGIGDYCWCLVMLRSHSGWLGCWGVSPSLACAFRWFRGSCMNSHHCSAPPQRSAREKQRFRRDFDLAGRPDGPRIRPNGAVAGSARISAQRFWGGKVLQEDRVIPTNLSCHSARAPKQAGLGSCLPGDGSPAPPGPPLPVPCGAWAQCCRRWRQPSRCWSRSAARGWSSPRRRSGPPSWCAEGLRRPAFPCHSVVCYVT